MAHPNSNPGELQEQLNSKSDLFKVEELEARLEMRTWKETKDEIEEDTGVDLDEVVNP